jgi:ubiquinone/menaquinone biosynthesis C-methylase UbiE
MASYDPEVYWSRVAEEIQKRGANVIAGDDNPYYRYKRRKFLRSFLDTIDFQSKNVLEVGCGPGGNLRHIAAHHAPKKIYGADVSPKMLEVAAKNLSTYSVNLAKIDGANLPYSDQEMDISLTVTVLQHNSDENTFKSLAQELARVTRKTILIMEDIGSGQSDTGEWVLRPVDAYKSVFDECGFALSDLRFLNTKVSRKWYQSIQDNFISPRHQEGDPISPAMRFLIGLPIPITRILDEIYREKSNLAQLVFERQ